MKQTRKTLLVIIAMTGIGGISQAAIFRRQADASLTAILDVDQRAVATGLNGDASNDSSIAEEMAKKAAKKKPKPKPAPKPKTKAS